MTPADTTVDQLDRLLTEFADRLRRGERPQIEGYAAAHPDLAADIRELFPTLLAMEAARPADPRPLPTVAGYRILRPIGGGGMGDVYEAVQEAVGRRVALKLLRPRTRMTDGYKERFRREARAAGRLHHTNIVPVFDAGEADGHLYYAMQFIPGRGLDAVLAAVRRREPTATAGSDLTRTLSRGGGRDYFRAAARACAAAADALGYAHRQGVLHRDVKPSNLLLDDAGTVWVADFGLAKEADGEPLTDTGDIIGTLRYMAPERFDGGDDHRADVYALGLTVYELAARRPAFDGPADQGMIRRILAGPPPRPRAAAADVPKDLETIILKATARRPADRYSSADALADDLRRFADGLPVSARRTGTFGRTVRAARANPLVAGLAGLVVAVSAVGAAGAGWYAWRADRSADRAERNAATARAALDAVTDEAVSGMLARQSVPTTGERRFLDRVLGLYEQMADDLGDAPTARAVRAAGRVRTGRLYYLLGRTVEAEAAFRRAAADAGPDDQGPARRWLADLLRESGRRDEAEQEYRAAVGAFERTALTPADRFEQVYAVKGLADVLADADRRPEAADAYRRGIALAEQLLIECPGEPRYQQQLALVRHNYGCSMYIDRPAEMAAELGRAVAVLDRLLAADPDHPSVRVDAARAMRNLAMSVHKTGHRDEAAAVRRRGLELVARLAAEFPADPEYRLMHAAGLEEAGYAALQAGRVGEADGLFRDALGRVADGAAAHPGVAAFEQQRNTGEIGLGHAELAAGRADAAAALFDRAAERAGRMAAADPHARHLRRTQAMALEGTAALLLATGRPADACRACDLAAELASGWLTPEGLRVRAAARLAAREPAPSPRPVNR